MSTPPFSHLPRFCCWPRRPSRWLIVLAVTWISCGETPAPAPVTQRLADVFEPSQIEGSPPPAAAPEPTVWRFSEPRPGSAPKATRGWEPLVGIAGLRVAEGQLSGETTSAWPALRLSFKGEYGDDDLREIRIHMRATAGERISVLLGGDDGGATEGALAAGREVLWSASARLHTGEELATYTLVPNVSLRASDIRRIFLRPTDTAGASFGIESIRLVWRREYYAEKPSGVSWEGLSDVYRETLVARAPEVIRWSLRLPERPWVELALGTLDEHPVTFEVALEPDGGTAPRTLFRRTVTTSGRWHLLERDLDEWAQRTVTLRLALTADSAGTVGLWGTPTVRERVSPDAEAPQGVVLILADTLRPDHISFYGHERETMPELARIARSGAVFLDAQAQGTWTKVSAASLLTSLYPETSGVREFPDRVPNGATTLAEVYRQAGYATLGFSSVVVTGKFSNLHQGFEVMYETVALESDTARGFVDELLPWLESHRDQRFFVFLHVFDPHAPYEPPAPYNAVWADPAWHAEHRREKEEVRPFIADPIRRFQDMPTRQEMLAAGRDPAAFIERELDYYDGSLRAMDRELARVFERLSELGLDRTTLVAFTSDHGEEFHDHGRMNHGHTAYGELAHVPLVLWFPGTVPAGVEIAETVQLLDVMPTLLELSGLPLPAEAQGQSLVPLLETGRSAEPVTGKPSWRPQPAIIQRPPIPMFADPPQQAAETTALVFEGWKLVHHRQPRPGTPEYELFDHHNDPDDLVDVAGEHPEVVARLAEMLSAWRRKAVEDRLAVNVEEGSDLSPEELERLRALGYVQ